MTGQESRNEYQHTPGPWTVDCIDDTGSLAGWAYLVREVEAMYEKANASDDDALMDAANEQNAANVHLIAAAPDLLAALEAISHDGEACAAMNVAAWELMDAAILKARGQ